MTYGQSGGYCRRGGGPSYQFAKRVRKVTSVLKNCLKFLVNKKGEYAEHTLPAGVPDTTFLIPRTEVCRVKDRD